MHHCSIGIQSKWNASCIENEFWCLCSVCSSSISIVRGNMVLEHHFPTLNFSHRKCLAQSAQCVQTTQRKYCWSHWKQTLSDYEQGWPLTILVRFWCYIQLCHSLTHSIPVLLLNNHLSTGKLLLSYRCLYLHWLLWYADDWNKQHCWGMSLFCWWKLYLNFICSRVPQEYVVRFFKGKNRGNYRGNSGLSRLHALKMSLVLPFSYLWTSLLP